MTTTYCVRADVEALMSEAGVLAHIDDNVDGVESAEETLNITKAIERAAVEMNSALCNQYSTASLALMAASNAWCKWCNANIAAFFLFARRGNVPPASVIDSVQTYRDQLSEARWGRFQVPEQPPSFDHTPTVTNFRPEIHKLDNPIRVVVEESTGQEPVGNRKRHKADLPGNL